MGLPARPECVVRIPSAIFIGERATMNVDLMFTRETKVEFIDVRVIGRQGWATGSGESSRHVNIDLPTLEKRVMREGVLEPGKRTFPLTFTLPRGTAPSHSISPAQARLLIEVHVAIPWWRDGKYSFVAPVRLPPPHDVKRTPLVIRHPFRPKPGEPHIELSLASTTLVAGEALVGSCSVFHVPDDDEREVAVTFDPAVNMKTVGWSRPHSARGRGYASTIKLPRGSAGQAVPFRIGLPREMTPTFSTATHDVSWSMTATIGSFFRGDKLSARVPMEIVDARASDVLPPLVLAPRVADERVVATFERFGAAHRMTVVREELERYPDELPALVGTAGESEIRIGYAYRGEKGTFLVGRVIYPPLGIGLAVTPSSGLRQLFTKDIEIDVATWDRAHHVDGREAAQIVPFIRGVLRDSWDEGFARWSDDEIVLERGLGAVDESDIANIAGALERLAVAIARARLVIDVPTGIQADLTAWRALADELRGQLVVGDLSIRDGKLDLQPIEIGLVFGQESTHMQVRVGADQGTHVEWTDKVRELIQNLPAVTFENGVATGTLPATEAGDATRVRDLARALRAIVAAQYEHAGPYR